MSDAPAPEEAKVLHVPNPPHQISLVVKNSETGKYMVEQTIWAPDLLAAVLMSDPLIVYSKGTHPVTSQTEYDPVAKVFITHGEVEHPEEYDPEK